MRIWNRQGRFLVVASLLLQSFVLSLVSPNIATAEDCPKYDLQKVFFEEYYPDIKWDNSTAPRTLFWTTEVETVEGNQLTRKFSADESDWLNLAFESWDEALESINFQRTTNSSQAQVQVGLVAIQNNGYWTVKQSGDYRSFGTIQLSSVAPFLNTKNGFIETAQSEIGNLLGLGDISGGVDVDSVMKDPDTAPYGAIPLSDYDIDLIRQFYGESTCHSTWSEALKTRKANAIIQSELVRKVQEAAAIKAAAEAQAKADADALLKAAEAVKSAEAAQAALEAKLRAELAAEKKPPSKMTITCFKGKLIKKITGIKPVCPKGYKKR